MKIVKKMKGKSIILVVLVLVFNQVCFSFESPLKERIIIDTDCAVDDFNALNFLLSRPELDIAAIIVSEGAINPPEGVVKVKSLLHSWGKESIPVLCNNSNIDTNPAWRKFNEQIKWGSYKADFKCEDYDGVIKKILETPTGDLYAMLCLGTLNTAANLLESYPLFTQIVNRIVWYNNSVYPLQGYNYEADIKSAEIVLKSKKIRIDVISGKEKGNFFFDRQLVELAGRYDNILANSITSFYKQPAVAARLAENHFSLRDELAAIYLLVPELYDINLKPPDIWIRYSRSINYPAVREVIKDLIKGTYTAERNVVFNAFPVSREFFNYDVRQIVDSALIRYGHDEWKACVITDEFHGHLGIFSIIGAKMGIRAREFFGVDTDELTVVSYAGIKPPYSCLNDGIQVSTGATLGQGTISVSSDSLTLPEAIFTYQGKSVKLRLKDEYLKIINRDISEGIVKFGLMDDGYWKLVRHSALKYWLQWDRNIIFDIILY